MPEKPDLGLIEAELDKVLKMSQSEFGVWMEDVRASNADPETIETALVMGLLIRNQWRN